MTLNTRYTHTQQNSPIDCDGMQLTNVMPHGTYTHIVV